MTSEIEIIPDKSNIYRRSGICMYVKFLLFVFVLLYFYYDLFSTVIIAVSCVAGGE